MALSNYKSGVYEISTDHQCVSPCSYIADRGNHDNLFRSQLSDVDLEGINWSLDNESTTGNSKGLVTQIHRDGSKAGVFQ